MPSSGRTSHDLERVGMMVQGAYSAQVTRSAPAVQGQSTTPPTGDGTSKQAVIGALTTPSFLSDVK